VLISDIIGEVIVDVGGDVADTELTTNLLSWAKSTLRRFPLFTRSRLLKTTSTITLSSGANSASLPTGFLRETFVFRKSSGSDIEIEKHPSFKSVVNTSSSGTPLYYEIIGSTIYFDKNANADYTVYIEHSKEIDNVAAGDTWAYSSTMAEILKDGMKYYYFSNAEDRASASDALSMMKIGLDKIEEDHMVDTCGSHIDES